jgi:D-alanyl-D-alanine carboxypeptidase (penicillin-binding protein 5/6)
MMLKPDDMHLTLLMGEGEQVQVKKKVPSILMAPVREGQQVGSVDYYLGDVLVRRYPVYALQGVEKLNLRRAADRVLDLFLCR